MTHQLDVLVPSRGRPFNIRRLWCAIQDTAAHPGHVRLRVRLDDDDPNAGQYDREREGLIVTSGSRIRLAASWDELAQQAADDGATHLALWGDDNIPITPGWDLRFVERLERDGPGFAYGRDGVWDHTFDRDIAGHLVLPTATVWPVELYRALGWISPPGLTHLCIDLAWRDLGVAAGCLWFEPDVEIRHLHRVKGAPDDQTYRDANDDPAQVASDSAHLSVWRNGPRFAEDLVKVQALRDRWSVGAS